MKKIRFYAGQFYMFGFDYNGGTPKEVIVARPTTINDNDILFHFMYGHHSMAEYVEKKNILAVGDDSGQVQIRGWTGRYKVINQPLFDKYVASGAIQLD